MCIKKRTITKNRNDRIITREEETQIVALLRDAEVNEKKPYYSDVADLVEVMINTGLRQLEALELMYRDVDFTGNLILVRQTKSRPRRVPMTSRVATILKKRQEKNQDKPFNLSELQIRMAWRWVKSEMSITEPESLVLHSLRRTCVQRLVDAGVSLAIICDWLGRYEVRNFHRKAPLPQKKLTEAAEMLERYNHLQHQ